MKRIITLALTAAAVACGSNNSNNAATSRNNPGSGTSTLLVTADVVAAMSTATPPAPLTTFTITVRDGTGANVSGATVTVFNASVPDGVVNLTEAPAASGRYTAAVDSFPSGDFRMNVVNGTDSVQGVVVGGPGMQTINAPAAAATVTHGTGLAVSWTTPEVAKQVTVQTKDFAAVSGPDLGAFTIPAAQNPIRASQLLTITRQNEVDAAGGLTGSRLRATYTATVAYVVQ
jgi:hypothetical protein